MGKIPSTPPSLLCESGLVLPPDEIRQLLADKGIVGMGGATFPTHVKYAPQSSGRIIDTVILNGIECEPFITADYRVMMENAAEVIRGLKYFLKASLANKGIIAIEDNKPLAIELFCRLTADEPNISVVVCPEKYPQGSERHLIYAVTGRVVPERALPSAVGVIVDNVATAMQAALAVKDDLPCYERIVTVSGNAVRKPGNYRVRIGTLYSHLVEAGAQGLVTDPSRIISRRPHDGLFAAFAGLPRAERHRRAAAVRPAVGTGPAAARKPLCTLRQMCRDLPHVFRADPVV